MTNRVSEDPVRTIVTPRLELLPATAALLNAELESPSSLAGLLGAEVPEGWPPGEYDILAIKHFRDCLTENPEAVGWYGWYSLMRQREGEPRILIGAGGFFGPPDAKWQVEIGYSVARDFEGQGYATEIVSALVRYAFATTRVRRVVAHTMMGNIGSRKVLERAGFRIAGQGQEPGSVEYILQFPVSEESA
jgi:RimJ/RimL family protein N-acetyltransferase